MTTLDDLLEAGDRRRDQTRAAVRLFAGYARIGLWSLGWLLAKALTLAFGAAAGIFFGIGWCCARTVPALKFARTAFTLGWEAGRPPGGRRVPS